MRLTNAPYKYWAPKIPITFRWRIFMRHLNHRYSILHTSFRLTPGSSVNLTDG